MELSLKKLVNFLALSKHKFLFPVPIKIFLIPDLIIQYEFSHSKLHIIVRIFRNFCLQLR